MGEDGFQLRLRNFEGPFDLLVQLIQDRKLDITDVALHEVTDEFIAYTRSLGQHKGLDAVTEFLVVAATLLDLKAARLLPKGDMVDPADLELLEARDLLFARLFQYKAFKEVAQHFARWQREAPHRYARSVAPEEQFLHLFPPAHMEISPAEFALLASAVFRPKPVPSVNTTHVHVPVVSVEQEARLVLRTLSRLQRGESMEFRQLVAECTQSMTVVGRFLSLLELYRLKAVDFRQAEPLGDLYVTWTGKTFADGELTKALGEEEQ